MPSRAPTSTGRTPSSRTAAAFGSRSGIGSEPSMNRTLAVKVAMRAWTLLSGLLMFALPALADDPPEYRLKAAFLFNFALFTEWPAEVGGVINLCVDGTDPFGKEIDVLQ